MNVAALRGVMVHGFLRSVFEALDRHAASVDIVAISEVSLSFTIESKRLPQALLVDLERIADVSCEDQHAIVCLVGDEIHSKPGIAASVFNAVASARVNVRMISQGASEINISFVIRQSDVRRAVTYLHAHFFTNHSRPLASAFLDRPVRRSNASAPTADGRGRRKGTAETAINHRSRPPLGMVTPHGTEFRSGPLE